MYNSNTSSVDTSPPNPCSTTTDDSGIDTSAGKKKSDFESCLVCAAPTKGIHFQVLSCRACSAFFRRSVKAKKVYRCRRGNRNCDLTKPPNGKPICRFCRLQKCYAVGMRIETNSAETPVPVTSAVRHSGSSSPETEKIEEGDRLRVTNGNRLTRNTHKLVAEIKEYFQQNVKKMVLDIPSGIHSTPFQQLQYAFSKLREEVCPQTPLPTVDSYNKIEIYLFQEKYAKIIADMMMSCDPFVNLLPQDKWKIFQHSWPLIYQIERQFSSCEFFGYDINDHRGLLTKEIAVDCTKTGVYIDGMDPQKLQELMKFCFPLKQAMTDMLHNPIKQLQLTEFEICYIIGLIMFSVHGK